MGNSPRHIGSDRQLFVDDLLIDRTEGAERVLHEPVRQAPAIQGDRPWDLSPCAAGFMRDGDRFRAWYRSEHDSDQILQRSGHDTLYAESTDGITWEKPSLGLFEVDGSKDNNIVWTGPGANMVPFRDPNPDVPEDERYKAVVRTRDLLALASPDGINWRLLQDEPILTDGPFDSVNISFWDSDLGLYVTYTRGVAGTGPFKGGVRWIRRATSPDFRNWSELESIDTGETPDEHFYTNACVKYDRAPGVYLMFPSRYVYERSPNPDWTYSPGVNDIVFMSSRDGLRFDRSMRDAFIRPGLDQNNWHDRGVYIETGILHTSLTEISLYGMENSHLPSQRILRYTLRPDGFVSVNAGYAGGEMTTVPVVFEGGELEVNYSTSAIGSIRAEIQDAEGRPIDGFTLDDCPEKFGDEIEGAIGWNGGADLGRLAGTPVRLRFVLKDADLYALKFRS